MRVDESSPRWPYQQVADHLRERIRSGELGPKLPPISEIADEAGVTHMTVKRALQVLKDEGLVHGEPGRGVFVRQQG